MEGSASQAGFYYQNNIAALKIIESLFFGKQATHIRLENYEKGKHIDDVIIYGTDFTEYIQIKWSEDEENSFTIHNLLTAQDPKKSIFKQLAEGYNSVKNNGNNFFITLFTTKKSSTQKRPSEGIDNSLTDLIRSIIIPLKDVNDAYTTLEKHTEFSVTLEKIRTECNLDETSFDDFLRRLNFQLAQEPIDQIQNLIKLKMEKLGVETNLMEKLLDGVVNWSMSGQVVTKDVVMNFLGISERFEDKLSHYFRVEEANYISNTDFIDKVNDAISRLKGGYIFVEGPPGVGKSTALTKFMESYGGVILAYYCFIPDTKSEFLELRHHARHFLKSLCVAIEKQFPDIDLPLKYSDRYDEKLAGYIESLGKLDEKVLFLIDGLDHVHRNTTIGENTLLNQIKGTLPENVFFILSSQYKSVLSPSVAREIDTEPVRHIIVPRFTQQEMRAYLVKKGIDPENILDDIERVSGGIPLYLHYISEILVGVQPEDFNNILTELPRLIDDKINSYHEYLFSKIEQDENAKWILAILAQRKENTTPEQIAEILRHSGEQSSLIIINEVLSRFGHLLRHLNARAFSIFHNSFREFILSKTVHLNERFNAALISYYEQNLHSDDAYRNYFKHLFETGNYQKILDTTTIEWMKAAWRDYRKMDEIKANLEISLDAAIELTSMTELIRVGFIKSQVDQLSFNLENSELDHPTFFLEIGETANSLRSIWDGDFVLITKDYFCYYLGKYFKKTGTLPPHEVIKQAFARQMKKMTSKSLTEFFCAKALAEGNTQKLFEKIDKIQWHNTYENQAGYQKENHSAEKNRQVNNEIKINILKFLSEHRQYHELNRLHDIDSSDPYIKAHIAVSLIKCIIYADQSTAKKLILDLDFSLLDDETYFDLVVYCHDYISDEKLLAFFPSRQLDMPAFHQKVIDNSGMNFAIHEDIITLFGKLKLFWLYQADNFAQLWLNVFVLPSPARDIYTSILNLSQLWRNHRLKSIDDVTLLNDSKVIINELNLPRHISMGRANAGLFDHNSDPHFIASSIHRIYEIVFSLYKDILSQKALEEVINYWLQLEGNYEHFMVPVTIADTLNVRKGLVKPEVLESIISFGEKIVRYDRETSSLTNNLARISQCYGSCGYKMHCVRVYNELIEIGFGVGYRKDYQVINIIQPLRLLDAIDPEQSLSRIAEVFRIQSQLSEAGNPRMHHICMSYLIAYTAENHPNLSLELLIKEEPGLGRDETMDIVFNPLIKKASNEQLPFLLAIIKTIPRWKLSTDENSFLHLALEFVKRAANLGELQTLSEAIEVVKHNAIVEVGEPKELIKFSEALLAIGVDYLPFGLPAPIPTIEPIKEKRLPQDEKFKLTYAAPSREILVETFERSFDDFKTMLEESYLTCDKNRRNGTFRNEYHRSKSVFERFYSSLGAEFQPAELEHFNAAIRYFIEMKQQVIEHKPGEKLSYADMDEILQRFIEKVNLLYPDDRFQQFVNNEFQRDQWIDNTIGFINNHRTYLAAQVITEETIFKLSDLVSILEIERFIEFLIQWSTGKTYSICMLKLANRLLKIDLPKAKKILVEVEENTEDNLLFPREGNEQTLGFDLIESLLQCDKEFGKRFLLKSFLSQYGRYGHDFTSSLKHLVKYHEHFTDQNVIESYFNSNLLYNLELAAGLQEKKTQYAFIESYIPQENYEQAIVKYLVNLLGHPVIKLRELVLKSIYDLLVVKPKLLSDFFYFGLEKGSESQNEWSIIVLHAISLSHPQVLYGYKKEMLKLIYKGHFNIIQSASELILILIESKPDFLTEQERIEVENVNSPNSIIIPRHSITLSTDFDFMVSNFHDSLFDEINYEDQHNEDSENLYDLVKLDLIAKDFPDDFEEQDLEIHRRYNMNTNFDEIEIQSHIYELIHSSLNRKFHQKVRNGDFEDEFVQRIKYDFRLYDPAKLLFVNKQRPEYINWIPKHINESDFVQFTDIDQIVKDFIDRESEYVTIFESGSQRIYRSDNKLHGSTYFNVIAFVYSKENDIRSSLQKIGSQDLVRKRNYYANELPHSEPVREGKWWQLMSVSMNKFRNEDDLHSGHLSKDVLQEILEGDCTLDKLLYKQDIKEIDAFRWQDPYSGSSDRRRFKAISEGYTFKLKRDKLSNYLSQNNLSLCYFVDIRRSATPYRPENYMNWTRHRGVFIDNNDDWN